jgi:arylsulfate sulfotransferase
MKQRSIYLGLLLLCMACKPDLEEPYIPRTVSGFSSRLMPHGNSSSPLTATIITTGAEAHFVELRVKGKRDNDLVYRDERLQKSHSVPLIGLYPGFENTVFVRILDAEGKLLDSFEHLVPTDSLDVRIPEISILHPGIIPAERKLIFIEFRTGIASVPFIFDEYGEVRWYLKFPDYSLVRPIMAENRMDFYCGDYGKKCMYWFDWLGNAPYFPAWGTPVFSGG